MPIVCTKTEPVNLPDNYWYLTIPESWPDLTASLDAKGLSYAKSATKQDLQAIHVRHQRGLLSYEKCSVKELQRFCSDRGLRPLPEPASPSRATKQLLIDQLEAADEELTFNGLGGLPEEIRVLIYEEYFRDLEASTDEHIWDQERSDSNINTNNGVKAQPPITKTSRLIRGESLEPFYRNCSFRFIVTGDGWCDQSFVSLSAARFLKEAPESVLNRVENFILAGHIYTDYQRRLYHDIRYRWAVKVLRGKNGEQEIDSTNLPGYTPIHIRHVMQQRLTALQWQHESDNVENSSLSGVEGVLPRMLMVEDIQRELRTRLPAPRGPDGSDPRKFILCRQHHTAMPLCFNIIYTFGEDWDEAHEEEEGEQDDEDEDDEDDEDDTGDEDDAQDEDDTENQNDAQDEDDAENEEDDRQVVQAQERQRSRLFSKAVQMIRSHRLEGSRI